MADITTTSVLPPQVLQTYSLKLLSVQTPNFIHKIPAMKKTMPRNGGTTLRMRRYNALDTALVPLGNSGVHPPAQQLTAVNIDAEMSFYGTFIHLNEQVTLQNQENVLNEAVKRLGVSLRQTEDELTRIMLASTATSINCVHGNNGDIPTTISRKDVDEITQTLLGNDTYTIIDNIEGEDRSGTAPVRDAYFALASTKIVKPLANIEEFVHKNTYPAQSGLRSEWGAVGNLRFLLSSIGSITPNSSREGKDIANVFCVGMEAYACIEQDGYSAHFIYTPPDGPLRLNASAGYKFAEVPRILNDLWVLNSRSTLHE